MRLFWVQEIVGSNPSVLIFSCGRVAQLVEQWLHKPLVAGSSPTFAKMHQTTKSGAFKSFRNLLGHRQMVRQRFLISPCVGSSPAVLTETQ